MKHLVLSLLLIAGVSLAHGKTTEPTSAFSADFTACNMAYSYEVLNDFEAHLFPGCTDPAACNFDPGASEDDGSCCFDNCVFVNAFDTFGDGWNGAELTITDQFSGAVLVA